jgi:hypothetical protein
LVNIGSADGYESLLFDDQMIEARTGRASCSQGTLDRGDGEAEPHPDAAGERQIKDIHVVRARTRASISMARTT